MEKNMLDAPRAKPFEQPTMDAKVKLDTVSGKWNDISFSVDIPVKSATQDGYPYVVERVYSASDRKWWQRRRKTWNNREVVAIYTVTFLESF